MLRDHKISDLHGSHIPPPEGAETHRSKPGRPGFVDQLNSLLVALLGKNAWIPQGGAIFDVEVCRRGETHGCWLLSPRFVTWGDILLPNGLYKWLINWWLLTTLTNWDDCSK